MHVHLIIPSADPGEILPPTACPYTPCSGRAFRFLQAVRKPLHDITDLNVVAHRYCCLTCRRTFRVYPSGVSAAQTSPRVKCLAVLLYLLGLSYGDVSQTLDALGVYLSKNRVYAAVQERAALVEELPRAGIFQAAYAPGMRTGVARVKVGEHWLPLHLNVDPTRGIELILDAPNEADAQTLVTSIAPVAAMVGATVMVGDHADASEADQRRGASLYQFSND